MLENLTEMSKKALKSWKSEIGSGKPA